MSAREPWVSVEAVARRLGIAQGTDYRRIAAKGRPAHPVGRRWKFKRSPIEASVEAGGADRDREVKP